MGAHNETRSGVHFFTLRPFSGLAMGAHNIKLGGACNKSRRGWDTLARYVACGDGSRGSQWGPTWAQVVGTRNGVYRTEASQWARNGGSQLGRHAGRGGHIRTMIRLVKDARETLGLLAVRLALVAHRGLPQW